MLDDIEEENETTPLKEVEGDQNREEPKHTAFNMSTRTLKFMDKGNMVKQQSTVSAASVATELAKIPSVVHEDSENKQVQATAKIHMFPTGDQSDSS